MRPAATRVELGQAVVERVQAAGPVGLALELGGDRRESARQLEVVDHGPQVQARPPDQQGPVPAFVDLRQGRSGRGLEPPDGELLGRVDQVEQVVRHLGTRRRAGLGRADVHVPVHGHRVDRHDLDPGTPAGQRQGQRRLAGRGRPDQRPPGAPMGSPGDDGQRDAPAAPAGRSPRPELAAQVVGRRAGDPDRGVGPRGQRPAPAGAAKWTSLFWRVRPVVTDGSRLLGPFDDDLLDPAHPGLVLGQGGALDHHPEALEALGDDVVGDERSSVIAAARVPGRGEKMKV